MSQEVEKPKWLKRTQEGSWEPEILISGIILLALTQVPRLLDKLHFYLEERTAGLYLYSSLADDFVFTLLKISSYWLIAALVTHLVMRSIWVSFIGLSYVYPNGIQTDKLKLSPWFHSKIAKLPDFNSQIIRLEKICSSIYATAFLLVMVTISGCLYGVFCIFLAWMLLLISSDTFMNNTLIDDILVLFTLIMAIPYFLDFLTLGLLKRIRIITPVYRPIYLFMSAITFAPVYRGIYYGILSNTKRIYIFIGVLTFAFITFTSFASSKAFNDNRKDLVNFSLGNSTYDGYYRDQPVERYSIWAHIQSATVDNGVLELFLVHKAELEKSIISHCEINRKLKGDDRELEAGPHLNIACMKAWYTLRINDDEVDPEVWMFREMSQTGQQGIFAWIDIRNLPTGAHWLNVYINYGSDFRDALRAQIPFYSTYDKSDAQLSAPIKSNE